MRIATSQLQQRAADFMIKQQAQLSQTQQQVASGKRILTAADDPAGATRAMGLEREIAATNQYQTNADRAYGRLATEDGVLASATNLLQRASELAIQGNNDTLNAQDRDLIATQLHGLVDELLGLANTRTANGEYLFSGNQGNTQPFAREGNGEVTYRGDQGQRSLHIGPGVEVTVGDSGADVFQLIPSASDLLMVEGNPGNTGSGVIATAKVVGDFTPDKYAVTFTQAASGDPISYQVLDGAGNPVAGAGGTYESGTAVEFNGAELVISGTPANNDSFTISPSGHQDVFTTIRQLAEAFEGAGEDPESKAELHDAANRGMEQLSLASENIAKVHAGVGSRLNRIDGQKDYNDAFLLSAQEALSNVQDLDLAEAITRLQQQITGLEAAQKSYMQIQGLSLFDYLS